MAYVHVGILPLLTALLLGVVVSFIACQAGTAVLSRTGIYPALAVHERIIFSLAIGYAFVSLSVLAAGLTGLLTLLPVVFVLGALFLTALLPIIINILVVLWD